MELRNPPDLNKKIYLAGAMIEKSGLDDDGQYHVRGMASTDQVDSYNEVVAPGAFVGTMAEYMEFPIVLFGHDWYGKPIGKTENFEIKSNGLWVDTVIATKTPEGATVAALVDFGILKAFSIAFWPVEYQDNTETGIRTHTKIKLAEISIVNVPANRGAIFDKAKELNLEIKSLTQTDAGSNRSPHITNKEHTMADMAEISKIVDEYTRKFQTGIDSVNTDMVGLTRRQDEVSRNIKALSEKLTDPGVNKEEFSKAILTLGVDIKSIQEDMNRIKNAKTMRAGQVDILTVRSMLPRNQGKKMVELLLHEPIDLKSHPEGELIKAARNAFDTALLVDAYMQAKAGQGYGGIQSLKSWGNFVKLASYYDPEFEKAMAAGNTGYGLEWVWQGWSQELYDLFNLNRVLAAKFPTFQMPSETYKWPIKTSHATVYLADEPTTNNPDQITKSNFGTSNVTFTAHTHAAAIMVSEILTEDSIIPIVSAVMDELAWSMRNGEEDALINSDTTSTHRDTGRTAANGYLKNLNGFMGLRFIATDDSATFDTQSTSAGVGDAATTLSASDLRYGRRKAGKHGARKGYFYATSLAGYFRFLGLAEFAQGGTYNTVGTWNNGLLSGFDGGDLIVSENISEELTTAGIWDNSTKTTTISMFVQPDAFKIGHRRDITVDYQFDNLTRQYAFVGTMRMDFQKMTPSGEKPVTVGYNILSY